MTYGVCKHAKISIFTVHFVVGERGKQKEYSLYACKKAENCGPPLRSFAEHNNT